MKFIAKTFEGFEEILADELRDLAAEDIVVLNRAVAYSGDKVLLYKSNLMLRTCLKVLVFMKEFTVKSENDLYNEVKKIAWEDYFTLDETFAVDAVVFSSTFRHPNFMALKMKDAIVDRFREKYGSRPNVDSKNPTLQLHLHIRENTATILLDSSGSSLHLRGYRKKMVDAPINEVLAAGIIYLSGWDLKSPLIDPMCGSATFLCEAARLAGNIPPQSLERDFNFRKWKSFDQELWQMVCDDVISKMDTSQMPELLAFDDQDKAVLAARENIEAAGLSDFIKVENEDFFYQEGRSNVTLMFNPPYDTRLKESDIIQFYKTIGDKLKLSFTNTTAWIFSGNLEAIKHLGLRPSVKKSLLNGSLPSVLCRYDMYAGSKKAKWQQQLSDE